MGQIVAGPLPSSGTPWTGHTCDLAELAWTLWALAQSQWCEKVMPGANLQVTGGNRVLIDNS